MSYAPTTQTDTGAPTTYGLLAEFETVESLLSACEQVRDAGFRRWDAYAPFAVHGLNDAMGIGNTRLPLVVLTAGAFGAGFALLLQWWMNAHNYKLIISGKPFFSLPSNIPIIFELTILFAGLAAFVSMLAFNNLPMWYHPVFKSDRFRARGTTDRFYIEIQAADHNYDPVKTEALLRSLGAVHIEKLED